MTQAMIVITIVVLSATFGITSTASDIIKQCFKGTEAEPSGNVTLSCPQGQIISIDEVLFGRNKWGACVISVDDCFERTRIFHECDNHNNCSRSFKTYLIKCGYATVMVISYTCLRADSVTINTTSAATFTTKRTEHHAASQNTVTVKTAGMISRNGENNLNETGLIAGCVVAAVVTVTALVIAITMVIRRLMQKNNSGDDDNEEDSKQPKSNSQCACFNCFSCCTFNQSTNKQRLKADENTSSSSAMSRQSEKQSSTKKEMIFVGKDYSLANVTGDSTGLCPDVSYDSMTLSTQALTSQDTTNNQQNADVRKLDSNANSKLNSNNTAPVVYCNEGMEHSPKVACITNEHALSGKSVEKNSSKSHLKEIHKREVTLPRDRKSNLVGCHSEKQTPKINENNYNEPTKMNHSKFDAVIIPNTAHGTTC